MTNPDSDKPTVDDIDDSGELEEDELEPFREMPVGTNDPNIVGNVGPFDTPPGEDPES